MTRETVFVALLRGINVGKANRISMQTLRHLLADLGYAEVKTLLNSGNAVFRASSGSADAHAEAIARALAERSSVDVPVVVKSAGSIAAIVGENPYARSAPDPSKLLVAFARSGDALARLRAIEALVTPPERFAIGRHAAYLDCSAGIAASKAGVALLGTAVVTTRNWATALKLHAAAAGV
jgi:uncharacterized protein (DUF1697 family)